MTLARVPLTSWSFLVFSLIGIMSLPILLAELVLTYVRVTNGLVPLDARETLVGVMDSLHVAPAVYWVGIPVLGMAVDIIGVHTGRPVRAHRAAMAAVGALGVLSYGAGFLSFASVRTPALDNALLVLVIAAAVVPMLAVMGVAADSLRQGEAAWFRVALVAALLSGLLLVLGAAVSLLGLVAPVAVFLHDEMQLSIDLTNLLIVNGTMFHDGVRGLVLGAATVGLLAALHHWSAKIWGRRMGSLLGLVSMAAVAAGAVAWGAGGVLAGIDDQPAYPAALAGGGDNVELFTVITLIGIIAMAVGVLAAALIVAGAALGANESTGHDWSGATLEWATSSPPPVGNFAEPPTVESATPLLDRHEAGAGVAAGESPAEGDETAGEEA
jgi:heme/copper-type cytochrome/quinol oxidase subunit 1